MTRVGRRYGEARRGARHARKGRAGGPAANRRVAPGPQCAGAPQATTRALVVAVEDLRGDTRTPVHHRAGERPTGAARTENF